MKIGASTLAGLHTDLNIILEFIENLGLEYAELVHQFHMKILTWTFWKAII